MIAVENKDTHSTTLVRVSAPARLHLGFLDLNGNSGRKFGSVGIAINSFSTTISAQADTQISVHSADNNEKLTTRTLAIIDNFYQSLGQNIATEDRGVAINLEQLIPEHSGFGSGTQLNLAIGTALCRLHNIDKTTQEIAAALGRGARSGIGIATFDLGGFIVDGGLGPNSSVPPLLAHHSLPKDWRIVLIMDPHHQGVHGQQEKHAFKTLPTFPQQHANTICHLTLMQLLPAIIEEELEPFGDAITQIQSLIGDHFSPAQGGRYTSPLIGQLLEKARQLGHSGIAQSSWGPTGCIFVADDEQAQSLISTLTVASQSLADTAQQPNFQIAQANEFGAKIEMTQV